MYFRVAPGGARPPPGNLAVGRRRRAEPPERTDAEWRAARRGMSLSTTSCPKQRPTRKSPTGTFARSPLFDFRRPVQAPDTLHGHAVDPAVSALDAARAKSSVARSRRLAGPVSPALLRRDRSESARLSAFGFPFRHPSVPDSSRPLFPSLTASRRAGVTNHDPLRRQRRTSLPRCVRERV